MSFQTVEWSAGPVFTDWSVALASPTEGQTIPNVVKWSASPVTTDWAIESTVALYAFDP